MVFKNEAQLKAFLLAKCKNAVAESTQKIYRIIDDCLKQYYSEFKPDEYIRTEQLLHSLVKGEVVPTINGYDAEVYFDAGLLNYVTGAVPLQSGKTGWATWTGQQVLDDAMSGGHGGYINGTAIWGTSLSVIGDIRNLLLKELKSQGIPIK